MLRKLDAGKLDKVYNGCVTITRSDITSSQDGALGCETAINKLAACPIYHPPVGGDVNTVIRLYCVSLQ